MQTISLHRGAPSMLAREVRAHPARFSQVLPLDLRRHPLLFAASAFATGILLSPLWRPAALLVIATTLLLVVAALALRFSTRLAGSVVLLCWIALGWTAGVLHPRAVPARSVLPLTDGLRRDVIATVIALKPLPPRLDAGQGDPQRWGEQANDQEPAQTPQDFAADLQLQQIEDLDPDTSHMVPVSGTARVVLSAADAEALHCGTQVRATLRLYRPREFRDPGVWSYRSWLAEQDVQATGNVVANHLHTGLPQRARLPCRLQRARTWASDRLRSFGTWQRALHLPAILTWQQEDVAAWSAMLFGDRTALTHTLRASFEQTGTFHLFVVSGMHIGLIAWVTLWLLERLRAERMVASLLTALVTSAYAVLTGFGPPVQRALLMTLVFLLAEALFRRRSPMNAVGAAALCMLVLRPGDLWDSSFQMTVLIALTIAGLAVPLLDRTIGPYARACRHLPLLRLDRRLPPRVAQFRVMLRWCCRELEKTCGRWAGWMLHRSVQGLLIVACTTVVALVTELTMALPMAVYFHRFTWLALPANLLVMPLLLPLMLCGMAAFLLCLVGYPLALAASMPAALLLHATTFVVRRLAAAHFDLRTPGPLPLTAFCLCACIGLSVVLLRSANRRAAWLGVACACAVVAGIAVFPRRSRATGALQVAALDVGQGDSILITAPNGRTLLVDAGGTVGAEQDSSQAARQSAFDVGEEVVSPYLWQRGVQRLDVLVLSHAHMDHLGGMAAVLRNFRPRELWLSVDVPSPRLHDLIAHARAQGTAVRFLRAGTHGNWQGIGMEVLGPGGAYRPGSEPANDDSLVLRATLGRSSVLLAGDAEQASEDSMLPLLKPVTLLKVGHHGSLTSSSGAFLNALQPKAAVISCGRGNHFGHPRMPVLQRLQERHAATSRTDTMGAVEYTLHADGSLQTAIPVTEP